MPCLAEQVVQAEPEKALEAVKQAATNPEPRAPDPPEGEIIAEASEAGTLSQKGAATAIDETKQSATGTSRHCAWGIWRKDPASTQDFILIQIAQPGRKVRAIFRIFCWGLATKNELCHKGSDIKAAFSGRIAKALFSIWFMFLQAEC